MQRRKWLLPIGIVLCAIGIAGLLLAADEITFDASIEVNKDALELERNPGAQLIDMTGDAISDIVQSFGIVETNAITVAAGVSTYGVGWFRNVTTNANYYVEVGYSPDAGTNFYPFLRLMGSEYTPVHLSPNAILYATAGVGTCNLRTIIVED
jgi:hypothetical protein